MISLSSQQKGRTISRDVTSCGLMTVMSPRISFLQLPLLRNFNLGLEERPPVEPKEVLRVSVDGVLS